MAKELIDSRSGLIIIRVDGARLWGLSMGHLTRACSLAGALRERGGDALLVMKNYPEGVEYARARGLAVSLLDPADDGEERLGCLVDQERPRALVVDLPRTPYRDLFPQCRGRGVRTVVFDLAGGLDCAPDHIVNDALAPELTRYPGLSTHTVLHLGPDYSVLPALPPALPPARDVRTILVTLGGSDPACVTLKILDSLGDLLGAYETTVVLGPLFAHGERARQSASPWPSIRVVSNPPDFPALMAGSDLVLSAGGRTLYELAALGRPVVVLPTIEHEEFAGRAMSRAAGFECVGLWNGRETPGLTRESVTRMLVFERRMRCFESGRALVDGRGIERIAGLLAISAP